MNILNNKYLIDFQNSKNYANLQIIAIIVAFASDSPAFAK